MDDDKIFIIQLKIVPFITAIINIETCFITATMAMSISGHLLMPIFCLRRRRYSDSAAHLPLVDGWIQAPRHKRLVISLFACVSGSLHFAFSSWSLVGISQDIGGSRWTRGDGVAWYRYVAPCGPSLSWFALSLFRLEFSCYLDIHRFTHLQL